MRSVRVDLQSNRVTLEPEPREELDFSSIPAAIHDAGFRPGVMRIRARGAATPGDPSRFGIAAWAHDLAIEPAITSSAALELDAAVVLDRGTARLVDWRAAGH